VQRFISRRLFRSLETIGFHLVGDHFYEPIPNTREITRLYRDAPRASIGINYRLSKAERLAVGLVDKWAEAFPASAERHGYREDNDYFRGLDPVILYCLIREQKPQQVAEIGQGFSTRVIIAALADNFRTARKTSRLVSVDPYNRLSEMDTVVPEIEFTFTEKPLQALRNHEIETLLGSDLVFVDSSHVHKFGSDVEFLFEHVYPVIRSNCLVHVHDVYSPYNYPLDWYQRARFWNEAHHLENFLRFNERFDVVLPVNYLARSSQAFRIACDNTCHHEGFRFRGSSFYFKRIAGRELS